MRQVTLYVPENTNDNRPMSQVLARIVETVAETYGGATVTDATGYWDSAARQLICEHVKLVSAIVADDADLAIFQGLARIIKREMAQESVLMTVTSGISAEFV